MSVATVGKVLLPASSLVGFILTILMGIAGALLGGFLSHWLGSSGELAAVLIAIIGSPDAAVFWIDSCEM